MSTEQNKELARRFYDAWNRNDRQALWELFSDDAVDHNPGPTQVSGKEGIRQSLNQFLDAFPNSQVTVDYLIAEGDKVTDHGVLTAVHSREFLGIPSTGKPVRIEFTDTYRIANGTIVEIWHIEDNLGLLQQIGAIPAHPSAQPPARTSMQSSRPGSGPEMGTPPA